ncbi:MAG: RdgB/HAM1 family non-canonical purine NTP pyrophosphatase [Candidatus Handelsmanbacteria bacterium]|nr:RdgB/HAM1 family non-canonical purine NTP pyrophosphatase [Candidatus Handelsmanbacteria bacterium]
MPLLVATHNAGKLREFRQLLDPLELVSAVDLASDLVVEETGHTFADNALLKARAFSQATGLIALADDSGLEVDALDGAPGVLSARYGGPGPDDAGRCRLLLQNLLLFPDPAQRTARFRCCLMAWAPDGRHCRAEGICEGFIAAAPAGEGGFGYDPLFFVPEHNQTMAQLPSQTKNQLSHRARALRTLHPLLLQTFPELG